MQVHSNTKPVFVITQALIVIVIGAVSAGVFSYLLKSAESPPAREPKETVYTIETMPVELAKNHPRLKLYGHVEATRYLDIKSAVTGEIIWVNKALRTGARIKQDETLLQIDPFSYKIAVAEALARINDAQQALIESESQLEIDENALEVVEQQTDTARKDFERAERLFASGSMTEKSYDDARISFSNQRQTLIRAQETIVMRKSQLEQRRSQVKTLNLKLQLAQKNLKETTVTVPFSGTVEEFSVRNGQRVSPGETLVRLYDNTSLEIRFSLPSSQLGEVITSDGQLEDRPVDVIWKIGKQIVVPARLTRLAPLVSARSGGIELYAKLADDANPLLRPGAFVELELEGRAHSESVLLPENTVYENTHIYRVNADSRLERIDIDILARRGSDVIARGPALKSGDRIMTTRLNEAIAGLKVSELSQRQANKKNQPDDPAQDSPQASQGTPQ